jgi:hypothetical protein
MSCMGKASAQESFKPSPHTSQVHRTIFNQPDFTDMETHLINRLLEKNPFKVLRHQENGTLQVSKIHARAYASAYYTKTRSGREHTQDTLARETALLQRSCQHSSSLDTHQACKNVGMPAAEGPSVVRACLGGVCAYAAQRRKKKNSRCVPGALLLPACVPLPLSSRMRHARTSHMHRPQRGVFRR